MQTQTTSSGAGTAGTANGSKLAEPSTSSSGNIILSYIPFECTTGNLIAFASITAVATSAAVAILHAYGVFASKKAIIFPSTKDFGSWRKLGVVFSNPNRYLSIRNALLTEGKHNVQIISDFDRTLSTGLSSSSHGLLEKSPDMPSEYREQVKILFHKYYPIELDLSLHPAEKSKLMVEWWNSAHNLLLKYGFRRDYLVSSIDTAISSSIIQLRHGVVELFDLAKEIAVPVLIFSAGIKNCIDTFLQQLNIKHNYVTIVSNQMVFDNEGALVHFTEPLIHSFNKNYNQVQELLTSHDNTSMEMLEIIQSRRNVLLFGDSLGDVDMVNADDFSNVLKIGYLNGDSTVVSSKLEAYCAAFDVVILNDGDFTFGLQLLRELNQS